MISQWVFQTTRDALGLGVVVGLDNRDRCQGSRLEGLHSSRARFTDVELELVV